MTIASAYKHSLLLFIQPEQTWKSIAREERSPKQLFLSLILPLLLLMAICNFSGYQLFDHNPSQHINMHIFSASATFLFSILSIYISSLLASKFAHFDTKTIRFNKAFTLIGYSFVPGIIFNSLAFLIPTINYLTILSLFSFYILYKGISPMLSIADDKKSGYFTFILIGLLSIYAVLGAFFIGTASLLDF
ncbi:Yip1 family protein [Labilibaculum antarcticum]|uniref:Yip1 family protein n=1 Tax=Labilibaculum antarcticum TaxID=1717717 RepID=UPI000BBB0E7C|nr:Yip1 family protein [Labilibaculum antarcticum]